MESVILIVAIIVLSCVGASAGFDKTKASTSKGRKRHKKRRSSKRGFEVKEPWEARFFK